MHRSLAILFRLRLGRIWHRVPGGGVRLDSEVRNDFPHQREGSCRISMLLPPALHSLPELA